MADWTEVVRQNHNQAQAALAQAVNRHSISVPIGDSDATAPGYLLIDRTYSCIPDAQYPWDPDIIHAIRRLEPDAMPLVIRTTVRYSNYYDHGRLGDPITIVRHGLARAIRNPISPVHNYPVDMPSTPYPGLLIPGRTLAQSRPNYLELEFYSRTVRPYGHDLPGAYEPFDWDCYYRISDGWYRMKEERDRTRRETKDGQVRAVGAANGVVEREYDLKAQTAASRTSEAAYITRDLSRYHSIEPSDAEWREANLGEPKRPTPPVSIAVP